MGSGDAHEEVKRDEVASKDVNIRDTSVQEVAGHTEHSKHTEVVEGAAVQGEEPKAAKEANSEAHENGLQPDPS